MNHERRYFINEDKAVRTKIRLFRPSCNKCSERHYVLDFTHGTPAGITLLHVFRISLSWNPTPGELAFGIVLMESLDQMHGGIH